MAYNCEQVIKEQKETIAALRAENKAQLAELHAISVALGTNEGHSSVAHIEELRKDVERLDYIQANARCEPKMDGKHVWWPLSWNQCQKIRGGTIREAIDAAIAAEKEKT